jgi:hypothetical protein
MTPDLIARLAESAAGSWGPEAAVWLLAEHGHWLPELERDGLIDSDARIDWEEVACQAGPRGLIGTPSELQVLGVAVALAVTASTPLQNLASLDEENRRLVLTAIAWAAGGSDWAWSLRLVPPAVRLRGRSPHNS